MSREDTFDLYEDHAIVHSGNPPHRDYLVYYAGLTCTCLAYSYRQTCRHSTIIAQATATTRPLPSPQSEPPLSDTQKAILDQITRPHSKE